MGSKSLGDMVGGLEVDLFLWRNRWVVDSDGYTVNSGGSHKGQGKMEGYIYIMAMACCARSASCMHLTPS